MAKNLVIVESPAKSKTIKKYLGNDFEILASYGHVRDLEPKESSVDVDDHFKMKYQLIERNKRHIDAIKKAAKSADEIYLATDPDREGEAISWHIYELLNDAKLIKDKPVHRIAFNEITKSAVNAAVANPRELAMDLVNAQQARRALDFLVGFKLSPLLWKKVRRGLSAGRVQSPALRMIVERELAIEAFESKEYWSITAELKKRKKFMAKLSVFNGQKCEQFSFTNETDATNALDLIKKDANGELIVNSIEKKQKRRNPLPPFITSTLQQDAVRKLGFTTKKAMMLAQQLYEGIEIGSEGSVGLITYMRTDSTNLSQDALNELRSVIAQEYGQDHLPSSARIYKTKNQNAQEAHEAIRPTSAYRKPEDVRGFLSNDQFKLYDLIWKRTVACQMIHALMDTVAIDFITENQAHSFKATGSVVAKPGFLAVYQEAKDEDVASDDSEGLILPEFKDGEKVPVVDIIGKQHFTEPPPRYTEASLVKALEEYGIGRPSTYATIISTLQQRDYALLEKKRFQPTDVGRIVNSFLTDYFQRYVEYNFTAKLEDELDNIADGKIEWVPVLERFWQPFIKQITEIDATVKKSDVTHEEMDEDCPECGHKLSIRLGRSGRFIGCTNYPACTYTRAIVKDNEEPQEKVEPEIVADRKCPECESDLLIKQGRYGRFIGCSNYPKCKHMEPLEKPKDTGIQCPKCKKNNFVEKKSRKGKVFYACAGYPKCKNSFWYPPIAEECPKCHSPILLHKTTKKDGEQKVCPNDECDYVVNLNQSETE